MKKVFSYVINGFFVVVFMCIVAILALWLMGYRPYVVKSGSMEPAIKTGSLVFVNSKYDYNKVEVGDIVAFKVNEDTLVTHRVIAKKGGMFETKGDNNDVSDGLTVRRNNFKGLTKFWIPTIGYFLIWLQTTRGRILIITLVLSLIILDWLLNDDDEEKSRKKENIEESSECSDIFKKESNSTTEDEDNEFFDSLNKDTSVEEYSKDEENEFLDLLNKDILSEEEYPINDEDSLER